MPRVGKNNKNLRISAEEDFVPNPKLTNNWEQRLREEM
jgi:hypothetical protein